MAKNMKKKLGEYWEKIDFATDPNIYLFYKHLMAGLEAFKNPQQSPDEAFTKYLHMLRIAETFLGKKFGVDFKELRKKLNEKYKDATDVLLSEIEKVAELLDKNYRKIEVVLVFKKPREGDT